MIRSRCTAGRPRESRRGCCGSRPRHRCDQERDRPDLVREHQGDDERAATAGSDVTGESPDIAGAYRHPETGGHECEAAGKHLSRRAGCLTLHDETHSILPVGPVRPGMSAPVALTSPSASVQGYPAGGRFTWSMRVVRVVASMRGRRRPSQSPASQESGRIVRHLSHAATSRHWPGVAEKAGVDRLRVACSGAVNPLHCPSRDSRFP
jgi:hypothetical protein